MKEISYWRFTGGKFVAAVLIMGCILAGCNAPSVNTGDIKSDMPVKEAELNVGAANMDVMSVVPDPAEPSGSEKEALPKVAQLNQDLFDGSDMDLWIGKDETLIALKKDTLYLYDMAGAEIIAEKKTEQWFMQNMYPCNDGFCMIGSLQNNLKNEDVRGNEPFVMEVTDDDRTMLAVFYNRSLEETNRLVLNDIVEYPDATVWSVSPDASMLAYFNLWDGLCIYDCNQKTCRQLLDFSGSREKISNLLAIDTLFFDEERQQLVFTGGTDKGNMTVESWGSVNLDGTGFANHIFEKDAGMAAAYKNGKLLLGEDSLAFEKIMGYADIVAKEEKYSTDIEGGNGIGGPVFSDSGETFAVTDIRDSQAVLTIYNTTDFSKIYQEIIRDENEEYFYRIPRVYLFDSLRVCLVCMGGHENPLKTVLIRY